MRLLKHQLLKTKKELTLNLSVNIVKMAALWVAIFLCVKWNMVLWLVRKGG